MSDNTQLLTDISQRLQAIGESVSEERIRGIVEGYLSGLTDDHEFVRKMRFGRSDPKLIGSKFARWGLGVADIEFLYDLQTAVRASGRGAGPSEALVNAFSAVSEAFYLSADEVRAIDRQAIDNLFPRVTRANMAEYERAMRAMDTAESGYGSQLVGAQYVGDLWTAAQSDMRIANLIGSFEMTAPTAYLPVEAGFPTMYYAAQSTTYNASNYTTSKTSSNSVTVSAAKFIIHQMWSGEMEEDSIIPYIPFLRRQAQKSIAFHLDSLALNGDTTAENGINGADSILATGTYTLAFDGIRHAALVDNTANGTSAAAAVPNLSHFRGAYGRMLDSTYKHDWGHPNDPNDLVHVVDPYTADALLDIDEFKTADKAGNMATILAGQITRVYNHPVISTIAMGKAESTGYVDETAGDNTLGQIVTFNRNGFKWGWRRRVRIETERIPATDQDRIVYSLRVGFGRYSPTGAVGGIECADEVYNIGL